MGGVIAWKICQPPWLSSTATICASLPSGSQPMAIHLGGSVPSVRCLDFMIVSQAYRISGSVSPCFKAWDCTVINTVTPKELSSVLPTIISSLIREVNMRGRYLNAPAHTLMPPDAPNQSRAAPLISALILAKVTQFARGHPSVFSS